MFSTSYWRKHHWNPISWKLSPMFPLKFYSLNSCTHFEWIILCSVKEGSDFIILHISIYLPWMKDILRIFNIPVVALRNHEAVCWENITLGGVPWSYFCKLKLQLYDRNMFYSISTCNITFLFFFLFCKNYVRSLEKHKNFSQSIYAMDDIWFSSV